MILGLLNMILRIWLNTTNIVKLQNSEMGGKKIVEFPWLVYK